MKQSLTYALFLFAVTIPCQTFAGGDPVAGKSTAVICIGCHAADGNSTNSIYPKLAGQNAAYLAKQLRDFKTGIRKEEHMSSMVEAIRFDDIPNIAAYFSQQDRTVGNDLMPVKPLGQKLYQTGAPAKAIPACVTCHGGKAQGNAAKLYPRLAGQHVDYLVKSLEAFRSNERQNDKNNVMRQITAKLSDTEIHALAQYLSTLP